MNTPNKRSSSTNNVNVNVNADDEEVERKVGEIWQDLQGDYYRLDEPDLEKGEKLEDGLVQRRLVECREKRRKYKLPQDARHPDAKVMHEVSRDK